MVNYEYNNDEQPNVVPSVVPETNQDYEGNVVSQHYLSAVPSEVEDVLGVDVNVNVDVEEQQSEY